VPIDDYLVSALKVHHRRQLEERLAWGPTWHDAGFVFVKEDGSAPPPEYFSSAFERRVKETALPLIRFHDTRHTCATMALLAGEKTEVVSKWLGHASVSITQDLYQHVMPAMVEDAGAKLTALVVG
jgi:integrase